jgi:hypothetical protein
MAHVNQSLQAMVQVEHNQWFTLIKAMVHVEHIKPMVHVNQSHGSS